MATTARAALRPTNEATRPTGMGRATAISVNHDALTDSIFARRLQFLKSYGLSVERAALIAPIIFGESAR